MCEHRNAHASGSPEIHNVVQADLKLLQFSCLSLLNSEITGVICMPGLCNAGNQTQNFVHARQALHQLRYIPSLGLFLFV